MGNQRTGNTKAAPRPLSDAEKLKLGESIWLHGFLVASNDGLLTLDAQGTQMIVGADDVRSRDELEGQTLLEVSPEANVIVRSETLLRAGSGQCDCPPVSGEPGIAPPDIPIPGLPDETFPDLHFHRMRCRLRPVPLCYPEYRWKVICWNVGAGR